MPALALEDPAYRGSGGGDNLFLASIVAVNADTGRYVWHYQQTPGEAWDYDATSPLMLADLKIGGKSRRVVMQASKNGFFYVLDAKSGQFISANNFVTVNWAKGFDPKTGRPNMNEETRYDITGKAAMVQPGGQGRARLASDVLQPADWTRLFLGGGNGVRNQEARQPSRRRRWARIRGLADRLLPRN